MRLIDQPKRSAMKDCPDEVARIMDNRYISVWVDKMYARVTTEVGENPTDEQVFSFVRAMMLLEK